MSQRTQTTANRMALCGLALALSTACAVSNVDDRKGQHPNAYGVDIYEPFDNSRDWGPSYLAGPPSNAPEYPKSDFQQSQGPTMRLTGPARPAPSIPSDPSNESLP